MPVDALSVLCAQLTRDLFAIAKFLFYTKLHSNRKTHRHPVFVSDCSWHVFTVSVFVAGGLYSTTQLLRKFIAWLECIITFHYKNLTIANRSRVSCGRTTSKASVITPWPWNLGYGSLKVTENGTIWKPGYGFQFSFYSNYGRISSLLWDTSKNGVTLKTGLWVRSRSLKMAPFDRSHTSSY